MIARDARFTVLVRTRPILYHKFIKIILGTRLFYHGYGSLEPLISLFNRWEWLIALRVAGMWNLISRYIPAQLILVNFFT